MATPSTIQNGRSLAAVLQDIIANIQEIFRSEFRLAKVEMSTELSKLAKSSVALGIGVLLGLYALGFLLLAVVRALDQVVDPWLASLIVGGAVLLLSIVFIGVGRGRLTQVNVVPEKTIGTVRENVQWAKDQTQTR